MKYILLFAVAVGAFLWNPVAGPMILLLLGIIAAVVYYRITARLELIRAARRIEPVFVVSRNPLDHAEVWLPEDLDELCEHTRYERVVAEVIRQRELLERAENPFVSAELEEDQRLPVIPILFRDGIHVNETWAEFSERAAETIKGIRAAWHGGLKQGNEAWYMRHRHRQTAEWN